MIKYKRMDLSERESIYSLLQDKQTQTSIARALGRNKSSISREIKRCTADSLGYLPDRADTNARRLMRRNPGLFRSSSLRDCVVKLLFEGWSPEQIAGRLKYEDSKFKVSHETIYKFVYGPDGQPGKLYDYSRGRNLNAQGGTLESQGRVIYLTPQVLQFALSP